MQGQALRETRGARREVRGGGELELDRQSKVLGGHPRTGLQGGAEEGGVDWGGADEGGQRRAG